MTPRLKKQLKKIWIAKEFLRSKMILADIKKGLIGKYSNNQSFPELNHWCVTLPAEVTKEAKEQTLTWKVYEHDRK
jgi:hypothetical protein